MKIEKIVCGNCVDIMKLLPENFIDLTVTSPPYDNLRTYKGYDFDFKSIADQLFRITKKGGVVVWVVGDQTIKGSETGTSFKQALYFKEIGFNLHDTMIYQKTGTGACGSNYAYWQEFEYMFVFSKDKIKTVNRIKDVENLSFGKSVTKGRISTHGKDKDKKHRIVPKMSVRTNIWRIHSSKNDDPHLKHPAKFPEKLANDHIISWSNPGDLVFDPMCGSGTTCKMAKINRRDYIGIDISQEYCDIAVKRVLNTVHLTQ